MPKPKIATELPQPYLPPATFVPVLPKSERRKRVVIVASRCADPLEMTGPLNVFQIANAILAISGKAEMGYDIEVVSSTTQDIYQTVGLKITADRPYSNLRGKVDTLIFTPMDFDDLFSNQEKFLRWVRNQSKKVKRLVSICSGVYILAAAGVLAGKRVATHWDLADDFVARYPEILLDPEPIYVVDEHLYTSAGMTAGLDLSVALVEEDFGRAVALRTAQAMVFFLKRPGSQAQFSTFLTHDLSEKSELAELQNYICDNLKADLRVEKLAAIANMSPRNFSRIFLKETGVSPGRFVEQCRLEMARQKLEQSGISITEVASYCGYKTVHSMRAAFERQFGINPSAYRQRFCSGSNF